MKNNKKLLCFLTFFVLVGCVFAAEMTDNIKKGISKMSLNRLDDALTFFEREISSNPGNGLGYYYAGDVYYRKGDFSKALELYQKAVEIEPGKPAYHLGAGIASLSLGQYDKAIEEFQVVINNSPGSYEAKLAEQNLGKIKDMRRNKEIVTKWQDSEKNVKVVEQVVEKGPEIPQPGIPVQTVSIETLVKDLRFGPETKRKEASKTLYNFPSSQLEPYLAQFISHMDKEKNEEVKKNLLLVIGKTQSQQAVDYLFGILENPEQMFDVKMVALMALSETLSPDAAEKLKNVLDKMVITKTKIREDAKARIESIDKRIDELESQKFVLRNDITKLRVERQSIYDKLNVQPSAEEGPGVLPLAPGVAPPEVAPGERKIEVLTPEQVRQLRAQLRTVENDINSKEARLARLEKQIENLNAEKTKYQQLLVKRPTTAPVKILGITRAATPQTQQEVPPGMPPEMLPGAPQMQPTFTQAGSEEEQEQSLALSIIKILGRIGKPEHLSVIERAWEEYRADSFELDYGLVRAQLGSYEYIARLVSRLQEDYPPSDQNEIYFRADIVKALGNYLATHENQDYAELVAYLAESDPNQVVKIAASQALSKIKTGEERPAKKS